MKYLYLIKKQYSSLFIREGVIMILMCFIIVSLIDAVSPLAYTELMTGRIDASLPSGTIYYQPSYRITQLQKGAIGSDEERHEVDLTIDRVLLENELVVGVGRTAAFATRDQISGFHTHIVCYNEDMIQYTNAELVKGNWFFEGASSLIPIVVGGAYRKTKSLGDTIEVDFTSYGGKSYTCEVVGIMDDVDMYFALSDGETLQTLNTLAISGRWTYSQGRENTDAYILLPIDRLVTGILPLSSGCLLFTSANFDTKNAEAEFSALGKYGRIETISQMELHQRKLNIYFYNKNIIVALTLLVFCILGLGWIHNIRL